MLVVLDIQHRGKPGRRDLGASHDLDGDGKADAWEHEANLTPVIAEAARLWLEDRGVEVVVLQDKAYSTRWRTANKLAKEHDGPVAYCALHLNMGADYGLVCHDERSTRGERLSREIAAALLRTFGSHGIRRVLSWPTYKGDPGFPKAINTFKGIWDGPPNISGVLIEALSMDVHAHLLGALDAAAVARVAEATCHPTLDERNAERQRNHTLEQVGRAIAAGCLEWLNIYTARSS